MWATFNISTVVALVKNTNDLVVVLLYFIFDIYLPHTSCYLCSLEILFTLWLFIYLKRYIKCMHHKKNLTQKSFLMVSYVILTHLIHFLRYLYIFLSIHSCKTWLMIFITFFVSYVWSVIINNDDACTWLICVTTTTTKKKNRKTTMLLFRSNT